MPHAIHFERIHVGTYPNCDAHAQLYRRLKDSLLDEIACASCMDEPMFEQLPQDTCPLCRRHTWLWHEIKSDVTACGACHSNLKNATLHDGAPPRSTPVTRALLRHQMH